MSAHVFEFSFENNLTKKQSFEYFNQILVRHALFRPPHSVQVFTYEECAQINDYWVATFCRFYEQYELCFSPDTNETIKVISAGFPLQEAKQKEGKEIKREEFADKFGELIGVNPAPKAPETI